MHVTKQTVFICHKVTLQKHCVRLCRWSEYTLYRILLDSVGIFDHVHQTRDESAPLICNNVCFESELPWDAEKSFSGAPLMYMFFFSTALACINFYKWKFAEVHGACSSNMSF